MPFGAFAPLPFKLGGTDEEGLSAEAHGRLCADLSGASATLPLAVMTVTDSTTVPAVVRYVGRNGAGSAYAPTVSYSGGFTTLTFPSIIETEDGRKLPWVISHAAASPATSANASTEAQTVNASTVRIRTTNSASATVYPQVSLEIYGTWGTPAKIGTYGGEVDKENDLTENPVPFAALWYEDLKQQRGSAYTQKEGTLVAVENIAMARLMGCVANRYPAALRNNSTPRRAGESLPYWQTYLAVQRYPTDTGSDVRKKLNLIYSASRGATYPELESAISELLGDAFVSLETQSGTALSAPPGNTYWPTINPGPVSYDLGGGAWLSERAQLLINVQRPGGMTPGEFTQLMNVDLYRYVRRTIPVWAVAKWVLTDDAAVWDGFYWDDGTVWDDLFDWSAS